jgi:hypothetical protein
MNNTHVGQCIQALNHPQKRGGTELETFPWLWWMFNGQYHHHVAHQSDKEQNDSAHDLISKRVHFVRPDKRERDH